MIINDNLFEEKSIGDILKEYYKRIEDDREQVDELITSLELDKPLISPFEAEGRARMIGVLLDARQKTTQGLANIANIAARLQSNATKLAKQDDSDDLWSLAQKQLGIDEQQMLTEGVNQPLLRQEDDVEDLVSLLGKGDNEKS